MADKPILFSGPMIRALLDGRKTQTRRALKPQPNDIGGMQRAAGQWPLMDSLTGDPIHTRHSVGDRLWVREGFFYAPPGAYRASTGIEQAVDPTDPDRAAVYREGFDRSGRPAWRPSIHMPRWASRLTLTVTEVRIERLQDISEDDAIAEGCRPFFDEENAEITKGPNGHEHRMAPLRGPLDDFRRLWDSINGDGTWESNPWVAAYSFTVERRNIDAREAA
jgi:hypothetical protein